MNGESSIEIRYSYELYDKDTFPYEWWKSLPVQNRKRGNQGAKGKNKRTYLDAICAFDIETTRIKEIEQSVMYIWQFAVLADNSIKVVIGRTWQEWMFFFRRLYVYKKWFVVFVHNLSYEFQFMAGIYNFQNEDVFALKERKVAKCSMPALGVEFRCSYIHSNMGLDDFLKKMGVVHTKLQNYDYEKYRFWYTPLKPDELSYCIHDVVGLVEAIKIEMEFDGDNLYTLPLTNTGYVRRDTKRSMRICSHRIVKESFPQYELYQVLREAFRGGDTHANRYYAGKILENVKSADRSSSYPDVQCNCKFPMTKFYPVGGKKLEEIHKLMKKGKAILMRVAFLNIRLKNGYFGCPYLSRDKSRHISKAYKIDNGRILQAEYLETTITDVDLIIFEKEYEWDQICCYEVWYARYGYLPKEFTDVMKEYYRRKTELKDVSGQELYYMKSKNKLNSGYGMTAQDPVKQSIDFIAGVFKERKDYEPDLLSDYKDRAFLVYQWGVWTTALARLRLHEGIWLVYEQGAEYVYDDTDSVKYIGEVDWTAYNLERIKDSKRTGSFAKSPDGITHYMGVYEDEGCYDRFATLGAKKYVVEKNGKLTTTIAGVNKKKGGQELMDHGGIEAFTTDFTFVEAGGMESLYNDFPKVTEWRDPETCNLVEITRNVVLRPSIYTLGITGEYERLLFYCDTKQFLRNLFKEE